MLIAKTNEQYKAFQNEIGFCETEIRKSEDHILELITASEPLDRNVKAAEASLKERRSGKKPLPGSAQRKTRKQWAHFTAERTG